MNLLIKYKFYILFLVVIVVITFLFSGLVYWWFHSLYESKHKYTTINQNYIPNVVTFCSDGTHSSSTGRGTCSWHGGEDFIKMVENQKYIYHKEKMPYSYAFGFGLLLWIPFLIIGVLLKWKMKNEV